MNNVILTVCDSNRMYCARLQEYLRNNLKLSFDIQAFTDAEMLLQFSEKKEISLLVISESALYRTYMDERYGNFDNVIILDEETDAFPLGNISLLPKAQVRHLSKYMPASQIADGILEFCTSHTGVFSGLCTNAMTSEGKIMGFFTPLSRSGQTMLLTKMGELLAREHKTIMLSFESFSALPGMLHSLLQSALCKGIQRWMYSACSCGGSNVDNES